MPVWLEEGVAPVYGTPPHTGLPVFIRGSKK